MSEELTRRSLLSQAAAGAAAISLPGLAGPAVAATPKTVPLPDAATLRKDVQRMVDMGPRYTGTAGHKKFTDWLERELVAAGVVMLPPDQEPLTVWEASGFGLDILEGSQKGAAKVATYYPRSKETGAAGVTAPLVYGGVLPAPALSLDPATLPAALAAYPAAIESWAKGLSGTLAGGPSGSILVVDVPMPLPLTAGAFLPLTTFLNWKGHADLEWATIDYKRTWLAPGVTGIPTAPFKALGAVGCVFILDASYESLNGNYIPFEHGFEDIPALFVDRDTGAKLRQAAATRPKSTLRLEAARHEDHAPALLGYLPGSAPGDEALFLNSHTDGEGFVEENGGVGMVALARHFGSLRGSERLARHLVFSLWPGHMATGMPQLEGVLDKHQDIVRSSVGAITIEHLGCSEWIETADKGYHPTGEAELLGVWTTQGKVFEITKTQTLKHDIPRAALLRPPVQFGVGGALQSAGVPQVGFLAGPYYLLRESKDGDMDKYDAALAAKQVAWCAGILRDMDATPAAVLAAGDVTLGAKSDGPKAKFPPAALALKVTVQRLNRLPQQKLRGTIAVGRAATVLVRAELKDDGRRTTLADRVVHLTPGTTTVNLVLSRRARKALQDADRGGKGAGRVVLTARAADAGTKVTRTASRRLGV